MRFLLARVEVYIFFLWLGITPIFCAMAEKPLIDPLIFKDGMLSDELIYPDWFKVSMGDFREDLKEAAANNKKGIIVYFGQKRCSYCEQFLRVDLGELDIIQYTQQHFDVIPVDIWGIEEIIDTDGKAYTERDLSLHYKTNFTPSLVFYDQSGKAVFRLRGFYPPYKFRAALKYVVEGFYEKERFNEYLARAEPGMFFMMGGLVERDFFSAPPHDLQGKLKSGKPLAVFFEQGKCHACELLHTGPLNDEKTLKEINKMQSVQLDMWSEQDLITPAGVKTTAKDWARQLGVFHTPALLFFDSAGKEIIRIDSIVQFYRLLGVLDYINKGAYKKEPNYQLWRIQQRKTL